MKKNERPRLYESDGSLNSNVIKKGCAGAILVVCATIFSYAILSSGCKAYQEVQENSRAQQESGRDYQIQPNYQTLDNNL